MHYRVKKVVVGDLDTNCYIIKQDDTRNAVVIDPGDDAILIKSELHEMDAFPAVILLTHGHFDHILALDELRTEKTVVCIHKDDAHKLKEKELGERLFISQNMLRREEQDFLDDVTLAQASFELGVPIYPLESDGFELCDAICGILPEIKTSCRPESDGEYYRYNQN